MICAIIHTCDKYEFCWDTWYRQFKLYWDSDIDVYFVNESKDIDYDLKQIKTGPGEWSDRLIKALDQLDYEYIFYMQEDAWMTRAVRFDYYYSVMKAYHMDALRLFPAKGKYYKITADKKFRGDSDYLVTHQPSIWRKSFLSECLIPSEDPWQNELKGTERIRGKGYDIRCADTYEWYISACRKGQLTNEAKELMK